MMKPLYVWILLMATTIHVGGQTVDDTGELVFPDETERIDAKAFASNKEVTRVVLSKNLKQIGDSAFYESKNSEEIRIEKYRIQL